VRQGGTSDNSIQLAGAGPGTSANQKDTANQMLAATESNLKKISAQQLSSDQQQMVSQIRQFMEQSKAAVGDGDLERARTLAWKAQVLSEELVKPAQ
jgi:ABC-type lipoprotein export system ATPase subunit